MSSDLENKILLLYSKYCTMQLYPKNCTVPLFVELHCAVLHFIQLYSKNCFTRTAQLINGTAQCVSTPKVVPFNFKNLSCIRTLELYHEAVPKELHSTKLLLELHSSSPKELHHVVVLQELYHAVLLEKMYHATILQELYQALVL